MSAETVVKRNGKEDGAKNGSPTSNYKAFLILKLKECKFLKYLILIKKNSNLRNLMMTKWNNPTLEAEIVHIWTQ